VEEFSKLEIQSRFEFVLMDAHKSDLPQFAFKEIFPKVQGIVVIHDLIPDSGPWNRREVVFYLWFLHRGGNQFLPISTLLDRPSIMALRRKLAFRSNTYKTEHALAKGIIFYIDGSHIPESLYNATDLRFDQFPPEDLTTNEIANLIRTAPSSEVFKEALRRILSRSLWLEWSFSFFRTILRPLCKVWPIRYIWSFLKRIQNTFQK
jgi:hypothetical protein